MLPPIPDRIAAELQAKSAQVSAAIALLDTGASVPFIARYRKEATGGLDDTQLRHLAERLTYLRELEERRSAILASIEEQGKLTDALSIDIQAAQTKQRLEDLYLPYKPKRRSKAQIAIEAGLEPLADALVNDPQRTPEVEAMKYLVTAAEKPELNVPDVKTALEGARHILIERLAEDAALLDRLRRYLSENARVVSRVVADKAQSTDPAVLKFRDWFDFQEPLLTLPSHRALALLRGRNEGVLRLALKTSEELADPPAASPAEALVAAHAGFRQEGRPADSWLLETARWAWLIKLSVSLELELMNGLRERSEAEAIRVFARNLHALLLAAPAGPLVTMGIDPGIRTGIKVAVVDATGKLLETATLYPFEPRRDVVGTLAALGKLAQRHEVRLIAIGNGTASRETDALVAELMQRHPELPLTRVVVSEAGASVYSASELAAREFPALDVSLRGAVSIARRLQDPLAELVKIEPKSIGVGQYQHDVNQARLAQALDAVVEDCVNAVGVDVNLASAALLARISGLSSALAENIVAHRDQNGAFANRMALKAVPRLGEKTFEQAAGFLRIHGGDNPLDASSVHPESYPLVERILADIQKSVKEVIGDTPRLRQINAARYVDERFGLPTVADILKELEKPGRDPRPQFKTAKHREDIKDLKDLQPGMVLEGTVTNVTNFGAFIDVGVHQDGLAHVSMLADTFVRDPHSVVQAGMVVKVKVIEVDVARKRVALSMRLNETPAKKDVSPSETGKPAKPAAPASRGQRPLQRPTAKPPANAMTAAFARVKQNA